MRFLGTQRSKIFSVNELVRFRKTVCVSVANQSISSGTNFAIGVYLATTFRSSEFGLYGIGFAAALLYAGVANALVITQMVVHLPEQPEAGRASYATRMLILLSALSSMAAMAMLAVFIIMSRLGLEDYWLPLLTCTTVAAICHVFKDFFVRYAYSRRREGGALLVNASVAVAALLGFIFLVVSGHPRTAVAALWIYALSQMVGALVGLLLADLSLAATSRSSVKMDVRQAWNGGRWALGGTAVIWLQSQAYVYISAATVGPVAVAYANAAKLFISPFQFLSPAISQLMLPRLASLKSLDLGRLLRVAQAYGAIMVAGGILYLVILSLAFPHLESLIFEGKYDRIGWGVAAWGGVLVTQIARESASTTLLALREFRSLMLSNSGSAVAAILATYFLARQYGASGAISGVAVGEAIFAYLIWRRVSAASAPSRPG